MMQAIMTQPTKRPPKGGDPAVGERMRLLRLAICEREGCRNQAEFARMLSANGYEITRQTWNTYETAKAYPPVDLLDYLYERYGVTFDYVYRGDSRWMVGWIVDSLRRVQAS